VAALLPSPALVAGDLSEPEDMPKMDEM